MTIFADELDDEELLECVKEAQTRGLLTGGERSINKKEQRNRLIDVLHDLMAKRTERALDDFEAAFFADSNGDHLGAAYRAMVAADWATAERELDCALFPTPARTATSLPLRSGPMTAPAVTQSETEA